MAKDTQPVVVTGSNVLYAGSKTGISTTGVAIATTQACNEVLVQASPDNTVNVLVGNSTAQHIQLTPGQAISIQINDVSKIYAKTASGTAVINYMARG